jgi:catechol 2,3-dioxygenase-like lactoylglutathione lyase family enzyme
MIYVTDIERSLKFYRDILGFRLIEKYPGAYARLRSPKATSSIALHMVGEDGVEFDPRYEGMRLYFEVKNLDRFCKRIQQAGITFKQLPLEMPWGWRHAYLNDPDGHEISLYRAGRKRLLNTRPPLRANRRRRKA